MKKPRQHRVCRVIGAVKEYKLTFATLPYLAAAGPSAPSATRNAFGSGGAAVPLRLAMGCAALSGAGLRLAAPLPLLDKMKSEMRGAISARKRDPLNTP